MATVDLSVVSSVGLAVTTGYAVILRYTLKREREMLEAKITSEAEASKSAYNGSQARLATIDADHRTDVARIDAAAVAALARIVDNEKAIIRQEGATALLRQAHDGIMRDLDEIKKQQVPRAEWERQMRNVENTLATILERIDTEWKPKSSP